MMRLCLLGVLVPFFMNAQHFSGADLKLLNVYSSGSFSNEIQAKADTHFVKAVLQIEPIWQKRKDGVWMFVQQTDSLVQYQVWHYYIQDDSTLILQFLQFKDAGRALQLSKDINLQSKLNLYDLLTRHGCEVYLKKDKKGYAGATMGRDCFAAISGVEYLSENISITRNSITRLEMGFDKDDKLVYGSVAGAYNFMKQIKPSK